MNKFQHIIHHFVKRWAPFGGKNWNYANMKLNLSHVQIFGLWIFHLNADVIFQI